MATPVDEWDALAEYLRRVSDAHEADGVASEFGPVRMAVAPTYCAQEAKDSPSVQS